MFMRSYSHYDSIILLVTQQWDTTLYNYVFEVTTVCGRTNDPCFLIYSRKSIRYYNVPNYKRMIGGQCVKMDILLCIHYSYILQEF